MLDLFGKKSTMDLILGRKSTAEKAVDGVVERLAKVGDIVVGTAEFIGDAGSAIVESCRSNPKVVEETIVHHYHRPVVVERETPVVITRVVAVTPAEEPKYAYHNVSLSRNHVWYYVCVYQNHYGEYVIDVRRNSVTGRVVGTYTAYNSSLRFKMEREIGEKIRRGYFD